MPNRPGPPDYLQTSRLQSILDAELRQHPLECPPIENTKEPIDDRCPPVVVVDRIDAIKMERALDPKFFVEQCVLRLLESFRQEVKSRLDSVPGRSTRMETLRGPELGTSHIEQAETWIVTMKWHVMFSERPVENPCPVDWIEPIAV